MGVVDGQEELVWVESRVIGSGRWWLYLAVVVSGWSGGGGGGSSLPPAASAPLAPSPDSIASQISCERDLDGEE